MRPSFFSSRHFQTGPLPCGFQKDAFFGPDFGREHFVGAQFKPINGYAPSVVDQIRRGDFGKHALAGERRC